VFWRVNGLEVPDPPGRAIAESVCNQIGRIRRMKERRLFLLLLG